MSTRLLVVCLLCFVVLVAGKHGKPVTRGSHGIKPPARPVGGAVLGQTAPRGWNSYDGYDYHINETEFLKNVDAVAEYLLPFGYEYAVLDYYWYYDSSKTTVSLDANGRLIPDPARFPHGLGYLGDYVHSKGLLFGIHIMRGIHKAAISANAPIWNATQYRTGDVADMSTACNWNDNFYGIDPSSPAYQAYYNSLAVLYASWGVDFIKYDCVFAGNQRATDIKGLAQGIANSGRPIAVSVSPGSSASAAQAQQVQSAVNAFRITNDLWDTWYPADSPWMNDDIGLVTQFPALANFAAMQGQTGFEGFSWPDPDMLPLGSQLMNWKTSTPASRKTTLTTDEQHTMMSLWSIARAPLMFGGAAKALRTDAATVALLTNPEILALQSAPLPSHQLSATASQVVWTTQPTGTATEFQVTVALFSMADSGTQTITVAFSDLAPASLDDPEAATIECSARDLWQRAAIGSFTDSISADVAPHASKVIALSCTVA